MNCYYTHDKIAGRVLIPGCMAVAISNDKSDCTCYHSRKHKSMEERVSMLEDEIKQLKKLIKQGISQ